MSKAKVSKQAKTVAAVSGKAAPKARKVVLAPEVAEAKTAILASLLSTAEAKAQQHSSSQTTRDVMRTAIVKLRTTLGAGKAYLDAIATLFGNGLKGKAHTGGVLRDGIPEDRRLSMAVMMHEGRTVALWANEKANLSKLENGKMVDAVKAIKAAKAKTAGKVDHAEREPGDAVDVTPPTLEQIIAKYSVTATFKALANILAVDAGTKTIAATCEALAKKTA